MYKNLRMTPEEQYDRIVFRLKLHGIYNIKIHNPESIGKIYNLFVNDVHDATNEPKTGEECNYYGLYYELIKEDFFSAKKYYLEAVEHTDLNSMSNLGRLYHYGYKDFDKAKHFYMMGIEHKHGPSMSNFGWYFEDVEHDFVQMEKYYRMAIEHGDSCGIRNLADYYETKKEWFKALELYMLQPTEFREQILEVFKHIDTFKFIKKHFEMITENTRLKLQVEHFRFKPGGKGAKRAKEHFESLIS